MARSVAERTFGNGRGVATDGNNDIFIARYHGTTLQFLDVSTAGGANDDRAYGVAGFPSGAVVITGSAGSICTFGAGDPQQVNANDGYFAARYTPVNWALHTVRPGGLAVAHTGRSPDPSFAAYPNDLYADDDGSITAGGVFHASITLARNTPEEVTLTAMDGEDAWLARYAPDGTLQWVVHLEGTSGEQVHAIAPYPDGGFVATGGFQTDITLGAGEANETTLVAQTSTDAWLARFAADGSLTWAVAVANNGHAVWGAAVSVLGDGRIMVGGPFAVPTTFGPGDPAETTLTPSGPGDVFLARYQADGQLGVVRQAGGTDDITQAIDMVLAEDGSHVVALYTCHGGNTTFGPGEANETVLTGGQPFVAVVRYNQDGRVDLAWQASGTGEAFANALAATRDGGVVIVGGVRDSVTFGAGQANETTLSSTTAGLQDSFVARYDTNGSLLWVGQTSSNDTNVPGGVAELPDGTILVALQYGASDSLSVPVTGGPVVLVSNGNVDIGMVAISSDGTFIGAHSDGGPGVDLPTSVAAVSDGSFVVGGWFTGTVTLDTFGANSAVIVAPVNRDSLVARYYPFWNR